MSNKKTKIIAFLVLAAVVLSCILIYEDKNLEVNTFEIHNKDLPSEFEGFRIAHISDLHNAVFGKDNEKLIGILREAEPDIIAITGDIIDSRRTDIDISTEFVKQAVEIAPCYYVTGNHEARIGEEYSALKKNMQQAGVIILDNKIAFIEHSGALIEVIGLEDPTFSVIGSTDDEAEVVADSLSNLMSEGKKFTVLLSHKPEFFDLYVENKVDLVLSGHTHAGQFVLPFVGGLVAPGQGFFPEYDSGLFENNGTNMVVSRGIGNSIIPLRINNRPEIVLIELHRAQFLILWTALRSCPFNLTKLSIDSIILLIYQGGNIMDILGKIFALITSIIFTFSGGGPTIAEFDAETSTMLTQTQMVTGELPNELQLRDFNNNSEAAFIIPGLKEGFIPQGLFYEEANDIFLISGYYKNKTQPSRVIVVDGDGTFIKSVGCQGKKNKATGHFGGIAVYKDNVYVATTSVTHVLSLSKILAADNDAYVPIEAELYTDTTCSYVDVCDGVLYIGEFTDITFDDMKSATNIYTDKFGQKYYSRCNAFILDKNAQWGIKADKIDTDNNMIPDFAFTSPFKVQGMARLKDGQIVYTASSTPITNSRVYLYEDITKGEPDEIIKVAGQDVPLYYCQKKDRIAQYRVPTYLEEITVYPDGSVYIITESAAAPYAVQSKNPIDYVIKWDINSMK